MTKQNDFVKIKRISEHLTGKTFGIRRTSKKFQDVIQQCNDAVVGILNDEQIKISKAITPITTEEDVIKLINDQNIEELKKLETFSKMDIEAFEMLKLYGRFRPKAIYKAKELAKESELSGQQRLDFEIEIFSVSALVDITHTISKGDGQINPDWHDIDVDILEFEMKVIE